MTTATAFAAAPAPAVATPDMAQAPGTAGAPGAPQSAAAARAAVPDRATPGSPGSPAAAGAAKATGAALISVLLADGHRLFRSALTALLDREADLAVVAEAAWGDDALDAALRLRPAVAVLDLDLPGRPALEVAAAIRAGATGTDGTRVLLLTAYNRPADVKRALADGVDGVLLKDLPPERLLGAVRTLAAGGQEYESSLLVDAVRARPGGPTPRELVVLRLVADGCSVAEVARSLSLSQGTVRNHVSSAIARTGARNRVDAIRIARESGWL
ncbi:response regulator transcription factor [Streptomyces sp. HPF1205]|uniref:response regulator n=1 Tax=Streptomyces sp. HPF1205 TaxID=2873262 RepID=UPI001CED56FF|nr:response regulator transcription factor [Streptomyces sp. HPF1205]